MLQRHDDFDADEAPPKLPPITGIQDLDCIVRNARLVYVIHQALPPFRSDEPSTGAARLHRMYDEVISRTISVLTGMIRESVPDAVVGDGPLEDAPMGSIALCSMKSLAPDYTTACDRFQEHYVDCLPCPKPKLLFLFDHSYSDALARKADVVLDLCIHKPQRFLCTVFSCA